MCGDMAKDHLVLVLRSCVLARTRRLVSLINLDYGTQTLHDLNVSSQRESDNPTGSVHHSGHCSNCLSPVYIDGIVDLIGTPLVGPKGDSYEIAFTES